MLSEQEVIERVDQAAAARRREIDALNKIRLYWRGRQDLPAVIPANAPHEVRVLARTARVNVCEIVIDATAQSCYVDGFRGKDEDEDVLVWDVWQQNKMDARQTGLHRATFAYGAAYATVLPGDPVPVIRPHSPRLMTVVYGEDPDWPEYALQKLGRGRWRLLDAEGIYYVEETNDHTGAAYRFVRAEAHNAEVTPVVRYLDEYDLDMDDDVEPELRTTDSLDVPMLGQVVGLIPVQDQINLTTFGLAVAQHYSAFKQRYIIGWTTDNENDQMKAAASRLWTFDDHPEDVKVGEFAETNLNGYIDSREASLRHAATLTQTPVHELLGQMINLSAEALVAAEKGRDRKIEERQELLGESHEQMLRLAGRLGGIEVPDDAEVKWRDTTARAFSATVDALGKMVSMLGVPPQEVWERIPGVTRKDVERWKNAAAQGDSFAALRDLLERQAREVDPSFEVEPDRPVTV